MEIEDGLAGHDSHLTSLFATFTRLTRQEEMPMREQLTPGGGGAQGGQVRIVPGKPVFDLHQGSVAGLLANPSHSPQVRSLLGNVPRRLCRIARKIPCLPADPLLPLPRARNRLRSL